MKRWRSARSPGLWLGAAVLLLLALGGAWALLSLYPAVASSPAQWQINLQTFGLLLLLLAALALVGGLLYRLASAGSIVYTIDRNAVVISWLGNRYSIPMDRIQSIDIGAEGARQPWAGARLFGYRRGLGQLADQRPLYVFATAPLRRCLVIYTSEAGYAISPRQRDEFVQELEQRRSLGVIQILPAGTTHSRYFNYGFWLDPAAVALLLGALAANLLVWGLIAWRYQELSSMVLLRLDPSGAVLQPRHRLLLMPLAALGLGLLNLALGLLLFARERGAALLLQLATLLVHLVCLAALLSLLR